MTKQFEAGKYAIVGKAAMPFCPLCQVRHDVLIVERIVPVAEFVYVIGCKVEYMYCSHLNRVFETDKQIIENKNRVKRAKCMASWATAKGFMDE